MVLSNGRVEVLINGAGGNKAKANTSPERSFFDLPKQAIDDVMNLNLMGTVPAQPGLRKGNGGAGVRQHHQHRLDVRHQAADQRDGLQVARLPWRTSRM